MEERAGNGTGNRVEGEKSERVEERDGARVGGEYRNGKGPRS